MVLGIAISLVCLAAIWSVIIIRVWTPVRTKGMEVSVARLLVWMTLASVCTGAILTFVLVSVSPYPLPEAIAMAFMCATGVWCMERRLGQTDSQDDGGIARLAAFLGCLVGSTVAYVLGDVMSRDHLSMLLAFALALAVTGLYDDRRKMTRKRQSAS